MNQPYKKKLIEVALPLESINKACKEDKNRKTGHIRNIHKWFAPMPLPALRAVLFASLIDAPANNEDTSRLLQLIRDLVASGPEAPTSSVLQRARDLLQKQLEGIDVRVLDPFCGGGSTLVEAQRLGLQSEGSDLNPLPVLITHTLTVISAKHRGRRPLCKPVLVDGNHDSSGFHSDIREYAERVRQTASESLTHLYPKAPNGDPIIYWWWAHTVPSPDPAFSNVETPLVTNWWLSLRTGDEQFLEPMADRKTGKISFQIQKKGSPPPASKDRCLFSNAPITYKYVREQARQGRLGRMLLAMTSDGAHGRHNWIPNEVHHSSAAVKKPDSLPSLAIPKDGLGISIQNYHIDDWSDLYTPRQQHMLLTFAEAIRKVPAWVAADGGDEEYGRDVATFLGLSLGKLAQASSKIVRLYVRNGPAAKAEPAFARGDIQLNWDFAETNPFGGSVEDWIQVVTTGLRAYGLTDSSGPIPIVRQADVRQAGSVQSEKYVVVTDPPYFSAIGYADLSEYFYYWLRLTLRDIYPQLFATMGVPKLTELIASPKRHGGRQQAAEHFINGFTDAFTHLSKVAHPDFPMVVIYAQRQEEHSGEDGITTGWEAMLEAIFRAGLAITGTWPVWGTGSARMRSHGSNSLASYIVMVCRRRQGDAPVCSVREFRQALRAELPAALGPLQQASIAPVDFAQAAIGPGMAVYTSYSKVVEAQGSALTVRQGLAMINEVLDELLSEQEGDFDADTRWALAWFEQFGFAEGDYGVAETLSKAKNTSVSGLGQAGILEVSPGKVRLLSPEKLPPSWDPTTDARLTVWEMVHHLIRRLRQGELAAAALLAKLGPKSALARELAYRLFNLCERKKRSNEAVEYNALVQSWPEITRLANENQFSHQSGLFKEE